MVNGVCRGGGSWGGGGVSYAHWQHSHANVCTLAALPCTECTWRQCYSSSCSITARWYAMISAHVLSLKYCMHHIHLHTTDASAAAAPNDATANGVAGDAATTAAPPSAVAPPGRYQHTRLHGHVTVHMVSSYTCCCTHAHTHTQVMQQLQWGVEQQQHLQSKVCLCSHVLHCASFPGQTAQRLFPHDVFFIIHHTSTSSHSHPILSLPQHSGANRRCQAAPPTSGPPGPQCAGPPRSSPPLCKHHPDLGRRGAPQHRRGHAGLHRPW